ncbi:MAG: hypothetical protein AABZ77_01990 [Chloroflexota bacterium]
MTEAETMELIKVKREDLARRRSQAGVSSSLLKVLEDEIKKLEATVPSTGAAPKPKRTQQTFLDECAG